MEYILYYGMQVCTLFPGFGLCNVLPSQNKARVGIAEKNIMPGLIYTQ